MFAQFAVLILKDGPQNSGLVLSRYIYKMAFEYKDMGYASAVSLVLFVIIMTLSLIEQKEECGRLGVLGGIIMKMLKDKKNRKLRIISFVILFLAAIVFLAPYFWMLSNSF